MTISNLCGSVHHICPAERAAFVRHINDTLAKEMPPIDPDSDQVFACLKDGVVFCELIESAVPGTLDLDRIHRPRSGQRGAKFLMLENHRLCLAAARAIGCNLVNISGEDLVDGRPYLVFGLLWQIIRAGLLYHVNLRSHPELQRLLQSGEDIRNLPQEDILLRWFNWHLGRTGCSARVKNFGNDLADSVAYAHLLHSLNPRVWTAEQLQACLALTDYDQRAIRILDAACQLDSACRVYLNPEDIVAGREKLNLCFIASLFNKGTGMEELHQELQSKNETLSELQARIDRLERENSELKNALKLKDKDLNLLNQENTKLKETLKRTMTDKDQLTTQMESVNCKLTNTAQSLVKAQKELTLERRQAETFGICADSLADELETFRSRQEKLEYLVEHLKLERIRGDANVSRLRRLFKTFPTTESLCRALYADGQKLSLRIVSDQSTKAGFLTKKARDQNNWRLRYLVVKENFLFYFKTDGEPESEPRGVIRLDDATIRFCENPTKHDLNGQLVLCIDTPDHGHSKESKNCVKMFVAGYTDEIESWREALQKAAAWWTRKSSMMSMQAEIRRRTSTVSSLQPVIMRY